MRSGRAADVLVLQHTVEDGPGYLGEWLESQGARWDVFCTAAGQAYPESVAGYRALAVLGGEWSANDDRPSLRQAERLILQADALGLPIIGHCLGGQLMARAFGGRVQVHTQAEIGWLPIERLPLPAAQAWLGDEPQATVFQWHYDSFVQLPPGAQLLARSGACAHQAFALGPHLGMQFHIEVTPAKIDLWLQPADAIPAEVIERHPRTVQPPDRIRALTPSHQDGSLRLARQIYQTWAARWKS
ncbi:MAG: type 1 glutamine amidotransferase [Rubrivivax sp.]|nr:type 1 glutamine amidotransferase [Rubrivivax sp.]